MGKVPKGFLFAFFVIFIFYLPYAAAEIEREDGYFSLKTEAGEVILETIHQISIGDQFINSDNELYEITKIDGDVAQVKKMGKVKLPAAVGVPPRGLGSLLFQVRAVLSRLGLMQTGYVQANKAAPIGIYHTHSDESYLPTSGTASKQWGDIYEVGKTLKESLEEKGFKVSWSRNNHNPHDGQAYNRSRATVFELLKDQPAALIDIHRDSIPAKAYDYQINGQDATKVMMVVGRENQNRSTNLEFAKALKANADARFPGKTKGILLSRGNYNQDLGPQMILLEFGTVHNSLEMARTSAANWASVLSAAVYGVEGGASPGQAQRQDIAQSRSGLRSVLWLLALVVIGGIIYLVVSSGGWDKMWQRVRNTGRELSDITGQGERDEEQE